MSNAARQRLVTKYWSLHEGKSMTFHEVLVDMYVDKKMSIREIGSEFCCGPGIVHKWLADEGINTNKTHNKIKFL